MGTSYEVDVVAWASEQAALLRAGKLSDIDIRHIAEEIEDVGKSEQRGWQAAWRYCWRICSSGNISRAAGVRAGSARSRNSVAQFWRGCIGRPACSRCWLIRIGRKRSGRMRSRRLWTRLAWTCSPSSGRGYPSRCCRRSSTRSNEKVTKNRKAVRIAGLFLRPASGVSAP